MKAALFFAGILPIVAWAAEDIAICPPITYTVDAVKCLYKCPPQPTLTLTTSSTKTVTQTLPCGILTIEPGPAKRAVTGAYTCSPTYTTRTSVLPCTGCATSTTAKYTLYTEVATFTTYKPCPTKSTPTIVYPTSTKSSSPISTVTPTHTPPPTTTTKTVKTSTSSTKSCPFTCSFPHAPTATIYEAKPTALDPEVICVQYCPPLYTLN